MSGAVVLTVRLTLRSGRDLIVGPDEDGVIHVRVSAPPVDGAANRALVQLLSDALRRPASSIEVVGGATSRHKRVRIGGPGADAIRDRCPGVGVSTA